jgi:glycine betaine/proline transport system ATP-binding protein
MNPLGVLTARDVMGPGLAEGAVRIAPELALREILTRFAKSPDPLAVEAAGQVIGTVTPATVAARLGA